MFKKQKTKQSDGARLNASKAEKCNAARKRAVMQCEGSKTELSWRAKFSMQGEFQ